MSVTDWVKGDVNQSGTSTDATNNKLVYLNHCCAKCGDSESGTGSCSQSYYRNTTNGNNPKRYNPYDERDLIVKHGTCVTSPANPAKATCPDYKICPIIGGIAPQVQWSQGTNKSVSCLYTLSTFTELAYVQEFVNVFPGQEADSKSDYNKSILPSFCLTPTRSCPIDPVTTLPMVACSRFISTDKEDPCYGYLGRISKTDADNMMAKYCGIHNTPDCLCINRFSNPFYQIMSLGASYQTDNCWWKPCEDNSASPVNYLVPFALERCPSEEVQQCQNIGIVIGGQSSNLTINPNLYTSCATTPYGNGGDDGDGGDGNDLWSKWWWLIIAAVVVIIVIVVVIILLL